MLYRDVIAEFVEKARRLKGLRTLILYGSVARGEAAKGSDVDLLAIVKGGEFSEAASRLRDIEKHLEEKHDVNLELVVMAEEDFKKAEKNFVENILSDGILLLGKPVILEARDLELHPYVVFIYYLKDLDPKAKQRLHIALYGHRTKKRVGSKEYVSEIKGWIEMGAKLERKVVMFPESVAREVRKTLQKYGAKFLEIRVYATPEEFEKIRRFGTSLQSRF